MADRVPTRVQTDPELDDLDWAQRAEHWRTIQPKPKMGPPRKYKHREPLILCGHGLRIRVDRGTLLIRNGLTHYPQKIDESRFFPGEANLPGRIVVLNGSGVLSLDAMQWMSEQAIEFVRLGWDGRITTVCGDSGYAANAKLVEAQRSAKTRRRHLEIANWLISEKLKASMATLQRIAPPSELRQFATGRLKDRLIEINHSRLPLSIPKLLGIEGDCARAYFRAWEGIPLKWKGVGRKPIPTEWHQFGTRTMTWRKRARLPRHPINAMLNYGYGILVHQLRSQVVAVSLDPTIGIIHGNSENPMPLVYDLMEPLRPKVDAAVLAFAADHTFAPGDFTIAKSGACLLNPQMARVIVGRLLETQGMGCAEIVRSLVGRLS